MEITPVTGSGGALKLSMSPERMKALGQQVSTAMKNGTAKKLEGIKTTGPSLPYYQDRYEGKTIVENKGIEQMVLKERFTPNGQVVDIVGYENYKAQAGAPTHGFFYQKTDFLMDAAKEYSKLGENEVFRNRGIDDGSFVRDALDFFTEGKYSSGEMYSLQDQITNVVSELAQQIKDGESPDINKVQSKLTIDGVDFTISQLLDFQKVGGELKEAFSDFTVGQLDVSRYGKMGLAKSLANYYASDKGEAGAMFSKAMNKLYDKGVAIVENLAARSNYGTNNKPISSYDKSAMKTGSAIRDTLASIDASNKERFKADFSSKLGDVQSIVQEHAAKFNVPVYQVGLAGATADLMKYFDSLLGKM